MKRDKNGGKDIEKARETAISSPGYSNDELALQKCLEHFEIIIPSETIFSTSIYPQLALETTMSLQRC